MVFLCSWSKEYKEGSNSVKVIFAHSHITTYFSPMHRPRSQTALCALCAALFSFVALLDSASARADF
jgi:hypothetical protein